MSLIFWACEHRLSSFHLQAFFGLAFVGLAPTFCQDVVVPSERAIFKMGAPIAKCVCFHPDGKIMAATGGKIVKVWKVRDVEELITLDSFRSGVGHLAFSTDGKTLATTGFEEPARLYDTATWKVRHKLQGEDVSTRCVAFSPDAKTLATVGFSNVIALWDVAGGRQLKSFRVGAEHVQTIAFSPDGIFLAVGGHKEAILWDLKKGKSHAHLKGHDGVVHGLVFSPDGEHLISADSGLAAKILIWRVKTGQRVKKLFDLPQMAGIALSPDGQTLAVVGSSPVVGLLDFATGRIVGQLRMSGAFGVEMDSVAFSRDGTSVAATCRDATLRIWDLPKKKAVGEPTKSK